MRHSTLSDWDKLVSRAQFAAIGKGLDTSVESSVLIENVCRDRRFWVQTWIQPFFANVGA